MNDDTRPRLRFGRIAATLPVRDMEQALAFYRDTLGLEVTFTNGDPVGFAILRMDDAELHLTLQKNHTPRTYNVAHMIVSDVGEVHDRCVSGGARIVKGMRDQEYGLRAFVFQDPDGNRIDVGQPI